MKRYYLLMATLLTTLLAACAPKAKDEPPQVAIIIPMEHPAMQEIVAGFEETLKAAYGKPITFKVGNAQHDLNLQRALIQQALDNNAMIVPVGTGATQMSLAMARQAPVISLAADFSEADRKRRSPCNVAVVHDEVSSEKAIAFIHAAYPNLQRIALIHSADDKVFPEVNETTAVAKKYGITIKPLMVQNLADLYTTATNIPLDTQAIFVLKDSPIVSGIATLAKVAANRHIPLITSDQGSVKAGANFAVGVHEKQIGVDGAKLAAAVLKGQAPCSLPIVEMTTLTVFVNQQSMTATQQSLESVQKAAEKNHYPIESYNTTEAF